MKTAKLPLILTILLITQCTSLHPVSFEGDGGYFKHLRRDYYKGQSFQEFEAADEATIYCQKKGYMGYQLTDSKEDAKFNYRYFKCTN